MYRQETINNTESNVKNGIVAAAVKTYQKEQLLNLSPVEVIRKLYDTEIVACKKHDLRLAQRVLTELISSLNFDNNEIAVQLFQLYDYCKRCLRKGNFEEVELVFEELRSSWVDAFKLNR